MKEGSEVCMVCNVIFFPGTDPPCVMHCFRFGMERMWGRSSQSVIRAAEEARHTLSHCLFLPGHAHNSYPDAYWFFTFQGT